MVEKGNHPPEGRSEIEQRLTLEAELLLGVEFVLYLALEYKKNLPAEKRANKCFVSGFAFLLAERAREISEQQNLPTNEAVEIAMKQGVTESQLSLRLYAKEFDCQRIIEQAGKETEEILSGKIDIKKKIAKNRLLSRFLAESEFLRAEISRLSGKDISSIKALALRYWCEDVRRQEIPAEETLERSTRNLLSLRDQFSASTEGPELTKKQRLLRRKLLRDRLDVYHCGLALFAKEEYFDKKDEQGNRLFTWRESIRLAAEHAFSDGNEHGQIYLLPIAFPDFIEILEEIFLAENK